MSASVLKAEEPRRTPPARTGPWARAVSIIPKPGKPVKTALLSLILGGTGQIALGQTKKGIALIAVSGVMLAPLLFGFAIVILPEMIFVGLCGYDALVMARRQRDGFQLGTWEFFWHRPEMTPDQWKVISMQRLGLSEEPTGVEYIRIDNSTGSNTTRTLRVAKVWSREYIVEYENAVTTLSTLDPKLRNSSIVKRSIEELRRERYNDRKGVSHTVEETVAIEVQAGRNVEIELHWKNIMDNWEVLLRRDGDETRLPVKIISKVTFDQRMKNLARRRRA